ncbi:MAG: hypothetical protein CML86_07285 [Rhodobiaceae bacterium]|nr:hypothetical protein [Rhodobiaceae bacterium]
MKEFRNMTYSQALRKYPTNYKLRAMGRRSYDKQFGQTDQKGNKTVTKLKNNKFPMAPKGRVFLIANNPKGGTADDFRSKEGRRIEKDNKPSTSDKERRIEKDNKPSVKKKSDKPEVKAKPDIPKKDFDKLSFNEKIEVLNRSKSEKDNERAKKLREQMKKIKARLKARRDLRNKKKDQTSGAKSRKENRN